MPPRNRPSAPRWACVLVVIALPVCAVLAVACVGDSADSPGLDDDDFVFDHSEIVVGEPTAIPTATRVAPSDAAKGGGVLMIEVDSCGVFDPAVDVSDSGRISELRTVHEIHAGLFSVADGRPPAVDLELASSYDASVDAKRFEFVLRPGLKFSDGSPLLASDVVFSWERALRKSTAQSEARSIFGRVVGAEQFLANPRGDLRGLRVVDDRRLVVELAAPDPEFLFRLARPAGYVVSQRDAPAWDAVFVNSKTNPGSSLDNTLLPVTALPVGAGPFALVEYTSPWQTFGDGGFEPHPTNQCVLLRNQHYWRPDRPMLDAVVAYAAPTYWRDHDLTVTRQSASFAAGDLDLASGVAAFAIEDSGSRSGRVLVDASTDLDLRFMVFNPAQ